MNKGRFLLLIFLVGLGLAACGSGGPTNNANPRVLFKETWEDYPVGSFPGGGWKDSRREYSEKKIEFPDNHKMLLFGPTGDHIGADFGIHAGGIYYQFKPGSMKPTYIRYNIHPYAIVRQSGNTSPPYQHTGNFEILGNYYNSDRRLATTVWFEYDGDGNGFLITSAGARFPGSEMTDKIPIDNSFLIELRNINWENPQNITFDFWVNGNEVASCLSFSYPIESITYIHFYNRYLGKVHFDNIYMADLPIEYNCPVVSEDPPTMPLPPAVPPPEPVLFIFEMPAFCRSGPSTEYSKITTYPEDAELEIRGQNLEGTWWWSEEGGCWVSEYVGRIRGDITSLEIIIPPPPPEDQDQGEDSPGKHEGCTEDLDQAACIEEGGTWNEKPVQQGSCICP